MPTASSPSELERICAALADAARAGGDEAKRMQKSGFERLSKAGTSDAESLVTSADIASQAIIVSALGKSLPGVAIVGEEQASPAITARTYITIDPIDGTLGYAGGGDGWGTIVGYVENGAPAAGVMYSPSQFGMARATRGGGCFIESDRIRFSGDAPFAVISPFGPWLPPSIREGLIPALERSGCHIIKVLSAVESAIRLLRGEGFAYLGGSEKVWDVSAAAVMVSEAGGKMIRLRPDSEPWSEILMPGLFARDERWAAFLEKLLGSL